MTIRHALDHGIERLNVGYPQGPMAHFRCIGEWRGSGAFEGLEFR